MGFGKWKRTTRGRVIAWGREEERASTELVQPSHTHVLLWYTHNLDWYKHHNTHMLVWYTQTANINSYTELLHWKVIVH